MCANSLYGASCTGYCKQTSKTGVSFGLVARQLNCEDYQGLIDRGWRRSGRFLYKPIMHEVTDSSIHAQAERCAMMLSVDAVSLIV